MGLLLLTLLLAYSRGALVGAGGRPAAVVLHRAAAPARRRGADHRRRRRRGGGRRGTSPATRSAPKASPCGTRHRRPPARRPGAGDAARCSRSPASRSASRPPGVRRRRAARRRAGSGAAGARSCSSCSRSRARSRQPSRPDRKRLARRQLAHQPERAAPPNTPGPPDRGRRACGRATGRRRCRSSRPIPRSARARKATGRRACAIATRRSKSGTPTATSSRRSPISAWSGSLLALALLLAWLAAAGAPPTRSIGAGRAGATWLSRRGTSGPAGGS